MEKILKVTSGKAKIDQQFNELKKEGIDVNKLIEEINEKTKILEGFEVKVVVKIEDGKYEILEIRWPKVTEMIKKFTKFNEIKKNKKGEIIFAQSPGNEIIGDIKHEDLIKIAKAKLDEMNTNNLKSALKSLIGTCLSVGITIDGLNPKEIDDSIIQKWIEKG